MTFSQQCGMMLYFGLSHLGKVISMDMVLRLKVSLFSRQKKPPIAYLQYRESTIAEFSFFSCTKSIPLMVQISFCTQSYTEQEGTSFRRTKVPRKEQRKRHRYIYFMAYRESFSFFIFSTRSPNFNEKYQSFQDWKVKLVQVKGMARSCLPCVSGSPIEQKSKIRLRRLKKQGLQAVSLILTFKRPYSWTDPHTSLNYLPSMPLRFMQANEGISSGMLKSCYSNPISFQLDSAVNRLRSSGESLGSQMSCFISSRKAILWESTTS